MRESVIVAFDPGRNIGVAFVDRDGVLTDRVIVDDEGLDAIVIPTGATVLVGNGTGSAALVARLRSAGHRVEVVEERGSTLEAKELYFRARPARGIGRLVPLGMRSPPEPIDDYAAYAIALRWLADRSADAHEQAPPPP